MDATQTLGSGNTLRLGLLAERATSGERVGAGTWSAAGRTSLALYVQDEWKIAPTLTINPGARVEWLRGLASPARLEPRASIVWSPDDDLSAHAGYARYASAPPLRDAGGVPLPEERDDYYDLGIQRRLGHLTLGIDGYWRAVRNLLAEHEAPGSALPTPFAFSRARVRGLEFTATYAHRGATAWANVAYSRTTGRTLVARPGVFSAATLAAASSRFLPLATDRPLTASAGFTHRFDELTLSADVQVSSGTVRTLDPALPNGARAPGYALVGLVAVYHVRLAQRATDLRIDLTNIAGVHATTSDARNVEGGWTRQTRGRALVVGIEQGF